MKATARLRGLVVKSLYGSLAADRMERVAATVLPNYNLHVRTGIPDSIPIQQIEAAERIVADMIEEDVLIPFIEALVDVERSGFMGHSIAMPLLSQILREVESMGLVFQRDERIFIEPVGGGMTKNWKILKERAVYEFSFLKIDLVDHSKLVRRYPKKTIDRVLDDFKRLVENLVGKRNGRIWDWQGDGCLSAFYSKNKNTNAVLCGIEIVLELFLYNILRRPLGERQLQARIAIHSGPCPFRFDVRQVQSETLKYIDLLEARYSEAEAVTVSPGVYRHLDAKLSSYFTSVEIPRGKEIYRYRLGWED
jgi:hypothetical protein